jgi:hypothetical protein
MSDLFDEATFPATTPDGKQVRAVGVERARQIATIDADASVFFATAPLRRVLIDLIPLARLAMAQESNADVRASEAAILERADQLLQALAHK